MRTSLADPVAASNGQTKPGANYYRRYRELVDLGRGCTEAIILADPKIGVPVGSRFLFDADGQLVASGLLGSTPFTAPLTLSTTPAPTPGATPILDLDLGPIAWPVDRANRIDRPLDDIALVVNGDLDADVRLARGDETPRRGLTQPQGMHRQVEEVEAEGEEEEARHRDHRDRDRRDQLESKRVYGRMVERT